MESKIVSQNTRVGWKVVLDYGNLYVSHASYFNGEVYDVTVTRSKEAAKSFDKEKIAQEVAQFVSGKLIRVTQVQMITESEEEVVYQPIEP